jgi:hypothetical protein
LAAAFTEGEASMAEGASMAEEGVIDENDAETVVIPIEGH